MSKLQNTTQTTEIKSDEEARAKAALKDKFEKAKAVEHSTYSGDRSGDNLTKVYQPPTPDLKK